MKKIVFILIAILIGSNADCFAQGKVTRKKEDTTQTDTQRKQQDEAKRQQEEKAKRKQEEANRKQGYINGHEWVDLGLPSGLKWATCNVGATSPEEYGSYFAWGETKSKSSYSKDNSSTYGKSVSDLKSRGIINSSGILNRSYDAASSNWGSTWHMPTKANFDELVSKCTWTCTTQNGIKGYKVTGPNGKTVFLPAAGYRDGSSLYHGGDYGDYWSSSVDDGTSRAYYLSFDSFDHYTYWNTRYYGRSVRPVSE